MDESNAPEEENKQLKWINHTIFKVKELQYGILIAFLKGNLLQEKIIIKQIEKIREQDQKKNISLLAHTWSFFCFFSFKTAQY